MQGDACGAPLDVSSTRARYRLKSSQLAAHGPTRPVRGSYWRLSLYHREQSAPEISDPQDGPHAQGSQKTFFGRSWNVHPAVKKTYSECELRSSCAIYRHALRLMDEQKEH